MQILTAAISKRVARLCPILYITLMKLMFIFTISWRSNSFESRFHVDQVVSEAIFAIYYKIARQ